MPFESCPSRLSWEKHCHKTSSNIVKILLAKIHISLFDFIKSNIFELAIQNIWHYLIVYLFNLWKEFFELISMITCIDILLNHTEINRSIKISYWNIEQFRIMPSSNKNRYSSKKNVWPKSIQSIFLALLYNIRPLH